jgi:hypothetical protein
VGAGERRVGDDPTVCRRPVRDLLIHELISGH